jgi:hypothetical protein
MALLKSVDTVPGIDYYEYRDCNYYSKYEYRMRVNIPGVRYTWSCKAPEELDKKLSGKLKPKYYNVRKADIQDVTDNLAALKAIVSIQLSRKTNKAFGMRVEGETVAFFSSDLSELKALEAQIGPTYTYDYTQVQTSQYAGIKHFVKEPAHKYRVYLKSRRVDDSLHLEFKELFKRQPSLYPSQAFKDWYTNPGNRFGIWYFRWVSAAYFIDYDDESTLSYLALMHGDLLGKKYKLEKRPDPV